jgi:2-oxoglutarate dehydrogenase complex dehydrogenase (E1) component-like enzyme
MPANYFHLLRRQMLRDFRKPMVVAAPKVGLKHPKAVSGLEDFAPGTEFRPTISRVFGDKENVRTIVFCSGKVSYDIEDRLDKMTDLSSGVTVVRVEEIAPFPVNNIRKLI